MNGGNLKGESGKSKREATFETRARWGECPVCGAGHGDWCNAEVGIHIGRKADGSCLKTGEGAHMARLQNAPMEVDHIPT